MIGLIIEGANDERKILEVSRDYHLVLTHGTKFSNREIFKIEEALSLCTSVYILTDPDQSGNWLANRIREYFPNIPRIKVDPDKAKIRRPRGDKFGIEYMSHQSLKEILPIEKPLD